MKNSRSHSVTEQIENNWQVSTNTSSAKVYMIRDQVRIASANCCIIRSFVSQFHELQIMRRTACPASLLNLDSCMTRNLDSSRSSSMQRKTCGKLHPSQDTQNDPTTNSGSKRPTPRDGLQYKTMVVDLCIQPY